MPVLSQTLNHFFELSRGKSDIFPSVKTRTVQKLRHIRGEYYAININSGFYKCDEKQYLVHYYKYYCSVVCRAPRVQY